jgi:CheY-like chemotaxis protein
LRKLAKEKDAKALASEVKALRVDLGDIFALDVMSRAELIQKAAEAGDVTKCAGMMDSFINAVQTLSRELKQCRTQENLEDEASAVQAAVALDIGSNMVNARFATVPKAKFVELYKRLDMGLYEKAENLANVLKGLGYDGEITGRLQKILDLLAHRKNELALKESGVLLGLLGAHIPPSASSRFYLLLADDDGALTAQAIAALGDSTRVEQAKSAAAVVDLASAAIKPDFIIVSKKFHDSGIEMLDSFHKRFADIPIGFAAESPSQSDITQVLSKGVHELFVMPLDTLSFRAKIRKFKEAAGK